MSHKYNVGDRVIVRNDLIEGEWYEMECTGARDTATDDMIRRFSGNTVTIRIVDSKYEIVEDDGEYWWTDEMFVGLAVGAEFDDSEIGADVLLALCTG